MLIQIGQTPKTPTTVVGLLSACHERIRRFTQMADRLAGAQGADEAQIRDAAAQVHRYFSMALPLHELDEEQSILSRLTGRSAELELALQAMAREHQETDPLLAKLLELTARVAARPSDLESVSSDLKACAAALDQIWAKHLEREEQIIFPAVEAHLDPQEQTRILTEMRARRSDGIL